MNKRTVIDPKNLSFEPFDNYGEPIKGMSWHKISYDKEKGQGSYILKIDDNPEAIRIKKVRDLYKGNKMEFAKKNGSLPSRIVTGIKSINKDNLPCFFSNY